MLFDYLDPLKSEINKLEKFIHSRGSAWRPNETETRSALINPLLKALGWDPADPALVSQEYSTGYGPADYALLSLDARPVAFIEAKKLGESQSKKHQEQIVRYAFAKDVPYAGLTNGNHWEFYQIFNPAELKRRKEQRESRGSELNFYPISPSEYLEHRRLLQVSIADDSIHDCALKLLLLSRSVSSAIQPTQANSVAKSVPNPEPRNAPLAPTPEPKNAEWVALSDMFRGRVSGGAGDPPLSIKFPDESRNVIQAWKDVLVNTAEWLYSKGLLVDEIPVFSRKKNHYIVNTKKEHPSGSPFERPQRLKDGLWVEARGGQRAIRNTRHLLRACGQNPAEVLALVAKKSDSA